MSYSPAGDGITHINVYSAGKTELGRLLSNFARTPFYCDDGWFASVEAYWYWLGSKNDDLRGLHGLAAKQKGRECGGKDWTSTPDFQHAIIRAIEYKIETYPEMIKEPMKESTLPFTHYYVFDGKVKKVPKSAWIMRELERMRGSLKDGTWRIAQSQYGV